MAARHISIFIFLIVFGKLHNLGSIIWQLGKMFAPVEFFHPFGITCCFFGMYLNYLEL